MKFNDFQPVAIFTDSKLVPDTLGDDDIMWTVTNSYGSFARAMIYRGLTRMQSVFLGDQFKNFVWADYVVKSYDSSTLRWQIKNFGEVYIAGRGAMNLNVPASILRPVRVRQPQ